MQNAALRALGEDACYHAFRVAEEDLEDALLGAAAMGFAGLNLTIPLKEKALELDFLQPDPLAQAIGAVNTVSFSGPRAIAGYNTDGWGALLALQDAGVKIRGKSVLIIGAGGAARAIAYTLQQEGAEISIANRSLKRAEELAAQVGAEGLLPERPGKARPSGGHNNKLHIGRHARGRRPAAGGQAPAKPSGSL